MIQTGLLSLIHAEQRLDSGHFLDLAGELSWMYPDRASFLDNLCAGSATRVCGPPQRGLAAARRSCTPTPMTPTLTTIADSHTGRRRIAWCADVSTAPFGGTMPHAATCLFCKSTTTNVGSRLPAWAAK
eukprot:gnl/TRDRNA2_/TRDRNA2_143653_c1_seq3.p2 gnl/TRDRNA2_/TRDRNA2_143653_c1~~gnl/TRDRNA2_/TRDRNA2_143653_c1_seq3.p2  ORF type:complete len:129 (-),score=10.39 gnl/TRDRNA2_/TRDRNA2_143653_c1_seq3:57-443(-)